LLLGTKLFSLEVNIVWGGVLMPYGKEEKSKKLEEVRKKHKLAHERARQLLEDMGFRIEKDYVVSNKPWDFIAKKHGLTYYVDSKAPISRKKGTFSISQSEIEGMLELRPTGIPTYLLILPDGRNMLLTAV
jgi:hypothetical protein